MKADGIEESNRQLYNNSWGLQTPSPIMNRATRVCKEIKYLNNIINYLDLTDIYRTLYLRTAYTFLSNGHETFPNIDHRLGQKLSLVWLVWLGG